jgi:hypothetical protein
VRSLPREQEEVVKEMRAKIRELKDSGHSAVNLYNCWLARRLVPLWSRDHYMWEYTGQNDCTRVTAAEWTEAEYRKMLAKITTAAFTSFDAEMQPFSTEKPAPKVNLDSPSSWRVALCILLCYLLGCLDAEVVQGLQSYASACWGGAAGNGW